MRTGFRDPSLGAARCFRVLLEALSRPGRVLTLPDLPDPPGGLAPGVGAALLTLADQDTLVWLDPAANDETRDWLRFFCGCPLTDDPARATLACVLRPKAMPPLAAFRQGDPEYPDLSATLLLAVDALESAPGRDGVSLSGPGVKTVQPLAASGLPDDFWSQWGRNATHYPLGVDLFLFSGGLTAGLPRSVRAEVTPCMSR